MNSTTKSFIAYFWPWMAPLALLAILVIVVAITSTYVGDNASHTALSVNIDEIATRTEQQRVIDADKQFQEFSTFIKNWKNSLEPADTAVTY